MDRQRKILNRIGADLHRVGLAVLWLAILSVSLTLCLAVGPARGEEISYRIRIPLPVGEQAEKIVKNDLRVFGERLKAQPENKLTMLLEFDTSDNLTGEGSSFENCLSIARLIQSAEFQGVRRIAYVPPPTGFSAAAVQKLNLKAKSELGGHAILIALACDELWMDQQSVLLGVGGDSDAELLASNYTVIAKRGLQWPSALVEVLVDSNKGLFRVTKNDGAKVFVDVAGRQQLSDDNQEVASDELASPGIPVRWPAEMLASWSVIKPPILGRDDLVSRVPGPQLVNLSVNVEGEDWKAARLQVTRLDPSFVNWSTRSLRTEVLVDGTNLLFISLETLGAAEFRSAADFADLLTGLDQDSIRTVALLPNGASGPETLVAMACDEIIIAEDNLIGGRQTLPVSDEGLLKRLEDLTKRISSRTGRDWSLVDGLALGNVALDEYRNRQTGGSRLLSSEQWQSLNDRADWQKQGPVAVANGMAAQDALKRGIVGHVVKDTNTAREIYDLKDWKEVVPTLTDQGIQRFARFLTLPLVSMLLLMFGFFALSTEMSSPGLGFPGFIGVCLLSMFFWAHYFDGSAQILEIVLFVLGLIFLLLELFVIPGFGVFGIGGIIMLLASIVLACQDFVLPRWDDEKQVNELASSLIVLFGGMVGMVGSILFMRYYLERLPFLNRLVLTPPASTAVDGLESESEVSKFAYLLDRSGVAITVLRPSGKAKFGNEIIDVITDGRMLDKDSPIRVYEVSGSTVKVEPKE